MYYLLTKEEKCTHHKTNRMLFNTHTHTHAHTHTHTHTYTNHKAQRPLAFGYPVPIGPLHVSFRKAPALLSTLSCPPHTMGFLSCKPGSHHGTGL
jgi:hypothetical protein